MRLLTPPSQFQSSKVTVAPANLKDNTFEVPLTTSPEVWSTCVAADGKVPAIIIKTTIALDGPKGGSSVLGGPKEDMKKALSLHFSPVWRPCAA
jgi:hypothetical protein